AVRVAGAITFASRLGVGLLRWLLDESWGRTSCSKESEHGLSGDPIGALGELDRRKTIGVDVVEDRGRRNARERRHLGRGVERPGQAARQVVKYGGISDSHGHLPL